MTKVLTSMALIAISSVAMAQADSNSKLQSSGESRNTAALSSEYVTGRSAHTVLAELELPDAPSPTVENAAAEKPSDKTVFSQPGSPVAGIARAGRTFWVANSMMLSASIVGAELIARCGPGECLAVPSAIRNRAALYGIAIPASLAVTYLSYQIKKSGSKWWYLPIAVVTGANAVYGYHAAQWAR